MPFWKFCRDGWIWHQLVLNAIVWMRVHSAYSLGTARGNSLLVRRPIEGQSVQLSGRTFATCPFYARMMLQGNSEMAFVLSRFEVNGIEWQHY
jgi:hypothetical protein